MIYFESKQIGKLIFTCKVNNEHESKPAPECDDILIKWVGFKNKNAMSAEVDTPCCVSCCVPDN